MKKFKKMLFIFLVFPSLFVTSCSNIADTGKQTLQNNAVTVSQAPVEKDKNPVTITTVSMFGGTDANAGNYQALNEEFMSDYPYITIEDDSQSSDQDWKTRIAADFAVGNEPDVIQYFVDANANDVLAANKFVSLDEIRQIYPDYAADTLPTVLAAAANPDGIQRAVPTSAYWEGLFCNKDLFDKYNLELPTDWDKFVKAIEIFQINGIIPIAVSLNNVPHYWIEFLILSAAGADGYTSVPMYAPEDWCRGLQMFKTLKDLGAFPADTDAIDNDYAGELFKNKQAAMQLDGSWYANGIPDQTNTVVVAFPVIPGGKATPGSMVGGVSSGFYITRKAWADPDKRDAAVKFVMKHTCKESVAIYWGGNGTAATEVDPIANMTPLALSGHEYSKVATSIAPTDARISPEAYNMLVKGIVDVSTGKITPRELLNKVLKINAKQ
jgi:raffinose/stachyose/melibiose transport system substrate-binding protein